MILCLVDFVIKHGLRISGLIQVWYDMTDLDIKKREVGALLKASKELKCDNLVIITEDYSCKEKIKGKTIKYVPLWTFLLKRI
jgi:hypothetical protein